MLFPSYLAHGFYCLQQRLKVLIFASYDTYHPFPRGQYQFYCTTKDSLLLTKMYTWMTFIIGLLSQIPVFSPEN